MSLPCKASEYSIVFKSQLMQCDGPIPLPEGVSSLQQLIFLRVVDSNFTSQIGLSPSGLIAESTRAQCCRTMATPCKLKQLPQSKHHCN